MKPTIDFWYSLGSTYTYLSAMRIEALAQRHDVTVNWRVFSVRRIMQEMDNRFLAGKPEKYAHMWRDIARRAAMYGMPANVPVPHPIKQFDRAHLVATLGLREGWGIGFSRASFHRWFVDGQEPGAEPSLADSLREVGQDPDRVLAASADPAITAELDAATTTARGLGIFGSPSFVVGGELFWGDDRLEDAISWAKFGEVRRLG